MTVSAQQPPRGYADLLTSARSDDRGLVTLERWDRYAVVRMNDPEAQSDQRSAHCPAA